MARLTLYGMMQYDPFLFSGAVLPEDLDKDILIDEIVRRSGMLYPYHQVPGMLKQSINRWFARQYHNFEQMAAALLAEYNPIENYSRYETSTRTPNYSDTRTESGKETNTDTYDLTEKRTKTGTDTIDHDGDITNEHTVSAFDSSDYEPSSKDVQSLNHSDTTTYNTEDSTDTDGTLTSEKSFDNRKTTDTHTGTESYTAHIHGNIGVTTNQQMIQSEIELRKLDIYDLIAANFEHEFIVQVY